MAAAGASSSAEQNRGGLLSIPKEGERIIAPTRRPDGTLRKAIRIRAGYVPQEEVAIYQSKGAQMKKSGPDVPPGYDPKALDAAKPKTKSAKRNDRRKEKRQQSTLASSTDEEKDVDIEEAEVERGDRLPSTKTNKQKEKVECIAEQMGSISISESPGAVSTSTDATESSKSESSAPDYIDKKIRALKKKIRLAEAQGDPEKLKPEQREKMTKVESWREELKLLEDKKATLGSQVILTQ